MLTDLDMLAIGLAYERPDFAREAHEASGIAIFAELASGSVGRACKEFRDDLNRQGRGKCRVSSALRLKEGVIRALKERNESDARIRAVAALLQKNDREAMQEIQVLMEPKQPTLKAVS